MIVMFDTFVVHNRWRKLIIIPKGQINSGESGSAIERLQSIRELFKPKVQKMNIFFFGLHLLFIVRLGVYCAIRFRSWDAFIDWIPIEPFLLYITYATELSITIGLFVILFDSMQQK